MSDFNIRQWIDSYGLRYHQMYRTNLEGEQQRLIGEANRFSEDIVKEFESLTASRDAWKKVALELEKRILVMDKPCCQSQAYHGDTHSPDCPIEQLRKMKEVEG